MQLVEDHQASYESPIQSTAGTPITLDGREWDWHDHRWLWCCAPDGREGWVPEEYLQDGKLKCDYSAQELSAKSGDKVIALKSTGGWVWCQHGIGEGWLPAEKLVLLDTDSKKAGQ